MKTQPVGHERQINVLLGLCKAAQVTELTGPVVRVRAGTRALRERRSKKNSARGDEMHKDFASPSQGSITCL